MSDYRLAANDLQLVSGHMSDRQANFGRFSLFFPKRALSSLRTLALSSPAYFEAQQFHSRRIGVANDGRRLRIDGGVRLSGRIDRATNIGFLHMPVHLPPCGQVVRDAPSLGKKQRLTVRVGG